MNENEAPIEAGAAGAPEGAPAADPTTSEIEELYKATGVKASVPTGKAKGRPKATDVRDKDSSKKESKDSDAKRQGDDDDKSKSKNAPDSSKDGDSGDDSDAKGAKKRGDSGEVSDESKEADAGVRKTESKDEKDSERGSEKDADSGDEGAEKEGDQSQDAQKNGKESEGKRPGKSNPEVERRFQEMTGKIRQRDEVIEKLKKELHETRERQEQAKVQQEDPEYTVDDFRKVRDEEGNVIDLDPERAELAWRRWKDGYEQRKSEREAEYQHQRAIEQYQEEQAQRLMQSSADAYDTLTSILDEYPELNSDNTDEFDEDFAADVMEVIEEAVIYQPGTEPGNEAGNRPVIVGMRMNPKKIIKAMGRIKNSKRSLPLNGVNDNVEVRSNVNVPHSRSSDPTVRAANELYKELGIDKRV